MKLVYTATGTEVKVGDSVPYVHHNAEEGTTPVTHIVEHIEKPRHGGSTGRVYMTCNGAQAGGSFPHVYDMEWIERDDQ